jgi:hypothetical protein
MSVHLEYEWPQLRPESMMLDLQHLLTLSDCQVSSLFRSNSSLEVDIASAIEQQNTCTFELSMEQLSKHQQQMSELETTMQQIATNPIYRFETPAEDAHADAHADVHPNLEPDNTSDSSPIQSNQQSNIPN